VSIVDSAVNSVAVLIIMQGHSVSPGKDEVGVHQ
jgi:hypothetical protein